MGVDLWSWTRPKVCPKCQTPLTFFLVFAVSDCDHLICPACGVKISMGILKEKQDAKTR